MKHFTGISTLLFLIVFLPGLACGSEESVTPQAELEVAVNWYREFESKYNDPHTGLFDRAKGSPGWTYTYPVYSYMAMYRAKKDPKWLDHTIVRIDNLIDQMREVPDWGIDSWTGYKDGTRGWGTVTYTDQYDEFMVHDGHTSGAIAQFVRAIYADPDLHEKYKDKADHYLNTLEKNIVTKWYVNKDAKRGKELHLREWGGWRNLPHNQYLAFGTLCLILRQVSLSSYYVPTNPDFPRFYMKTATEMARFFKEELRHLESKDAYLWDYRPGGRREDSGHGNLDIEFVIRAYRQGIVFDKTDMERFARTFIHVLWNKDESKPEFRSHVDFEYGKEIGKYHLRRWMWLYEFNPQIGRLISQYYLSHLDLKRMNEVLANLACWQAGVVAGK
jgi:hypothetical protein